ncbi:MAG: tetratricopeptide repeat protein [Planctomycetota bacterium]
MTVRHFLSAAALCLALAACEKKTSVASHPGPGAAPPGAIADARALLASGEAALRQGDAETAVRAFRAAAEADPRSVAAWARWHEALRGLKRGDEARREFEKRLAAAPDDPVWLTLAALADRNGREDRLRSAIRNAPDFAWAHCALCETLIDLKRYDEALRAADRAILLDPKNGVFRLQKAVALMWLGQSQDALAEADRAAESLPGDERVPIVRAQILMGDDRVDEAIAEMEKAAKLAPLAQAPKDVLRDWRLSAARRSLKEFDEAFREGRFGNAADASQRAAGILELVVRESPADEVAARLLPDAETASAGALLQRASASLREGKDDEAQSFCERATPWLERAGGRKLDQGSREYLTEGWIRLGALQLSLGDRLKEKGSAKAKDRFKAALTAFESCIAADPGNKTAAAMAAEARKALGP